MTDTAHNSNSSLDDTLTNPAELSPDAASDAIRLPDSLRDRYEILSQIADGGFDSMLLKVKDRTNDSVVVLKVYSHGLGVLSDILERIKRAEPAHVVGLVDYGTSEGIGFEVLEYLRFGNLEQYRQSLGTQLTEVQTLEVLTELTSAIASMHRLSQPELAHGGITPKNILVRDTMPLDLVLADFGLATIQGDRIADRRGVPRWSSPDSMSGIFRHEGDWWSLGVVIYWCLTGQPIMSNLDEVALVGYMQDHNVDLSALEQGYSRNWLGLCQGLLTRDEFSRWDSDEVEQWLAGEQPELSEQWAPDPEPVTVTVEVPTDRPVIVFGGREYWSLAEFGVGLAQHWDRGVQLISSTPEALRATIAEQAGHDGDLDLASALGSALDAKEQHEDLRLMRVIRLLAPDSPHTYRSWDVSPNGLASLGDSSAAAPRGSEAKIVRGLAHSRALNALDGSGFSYSDLLDQWDSEIDAWHQCWTGLDADPKNAEWAYARGRVLAALTDPSARRDLSLQARNAGGKTERSVSWYKSLRDQIGHSPGVEVAVIQLAPAAKLEGVEARERARAAANARDRELVAESMLKTPRTAHLLGYVILVQMAMALGGLALRVLGPNNWGFAEGEALTWWVTAVPAWLRPWLALWTHPAVVLPLLGVSLLLWFRARATDVAPARGGTGELGEMLVPRSRWERRAMQGSIAVTSLVVPVLWPFTIIGWVRGLQQGAPDGLRSRDGLRSWSMATGIMTCVFGALLFLKVQPNTFTAWSLLQARPPLNVYLMRQGEEVRQALAPITVALSPQRPRMVVESWMILLTWAIVFVGVALVVLATLAYRRRVPAERLTMGWLLPVGLVGMFSLLLAFLPISARNLGNWIAWAGILLFMWWLLRRVARGSSR